MTQFLCSLSLCVILALAGAAPSAEQSKSAGATTQVAEVVLQPEGLAAARKAPNSRSVLLCDDIELSIDLGVDPVTPPCALEAGALVWTRLRRGPVAIYQVNEAHELDAIHDPRDEEPTELVISLRGVEPEETIEAEVWWRASARDEWIHVPLPILVSSDRWHEERAGLVEAAGEEQHVRMFGLTRGEVQVSARLDDLEGEMTLPTRVPDGGRFHIRLDLEQRSSVCGEIVSDEPDRTWSLRTVDRLTGENLVLELDGTAFCFDSYDGREYTLSATSGLAEGQRTLATGGDHGVVVVAPRLETITGRLVAATAERMAGQARIRWGDKGPVLQEVAIDDLGEFAFDRPPVAFDLDIDVECCPAITVVFDDPAAAPDPLEIDLESSLEVAFLAVDSETGRRLQDVSGHARCVSENQTLRIDCRSERSQVRCQLAPESQCNVTLAREDYLARQLDIESASVEETLEVELSRGVKLAGRVIDSRGAGIPDVGVKVLRPSATSHSTSTDDEGRFELSGLAEERHLLLLDREGRRVSRSVNVQRDAPERDWILDTGLPWRSRVSGLPPRSSVPARVLLTTGSDTWETKTLARGDFTLESGPSGRVSYTVSHPAFRGDICTGSVVAEAPAVELELDCPLGRFDVDFRRELPEGTILKLVEQTGSRREHLGVSEGDRHSFNNLLGGAYALLSIDPQGSSSMLWQGDIFETREIRP